MSVKSFILTAIAGAVSVMPAPQAGSALLASPPKGHEFTLSMTVEGTYVSLNAVNNGTLGELVLQAERLSAYPGTAAYFDGSASNGTAALNFDLTSVTDGTLEGVYGLSVPEVGDNYGYSAPVTATFGFQDFHWGISNGTIYHKLDAALESFFACNGTINGGDAFYLAWGVFASDGSAPEGCSTARVLQDNNL